MSLIDSLSFSLATMGFAQLAFAMVASIAYALALNASLDRRVRLAAGIASAIGAAVFSILTPSWMSGVVLMALSVAAFAVFAGSALLLAELFGLSETRGHDLLPVLAGADRAAKPALLPLRTPATSRAS